ncbi:MAG: sulfatase-like hydrolase/transferase [Rhodobacteraceae bacterium]|nr:sulfatase-like hydrolase/transferase [Paracoccaceae bacterium]
MTRPNILVIQADQMTALCLSAYGKPYAITPNIDKMAANGTTFANSYCNNPVCGPSRASMMTGRLPSDVGVFDNGAEFLPSEPTYAHYLRKLGYDTVEEVDVLVGALLSERRPRAVFFHVGTVAGTNFASFRRF